MSSGSTKSPEESRSRRARRRSTWFELLLAGCLAAPAGCHPPTFSRGSELQAELSAVSEDDLLFLAASHARSGDMLRAEQYLSAARERGYDEAVVVYWLVRVCVAASRYQSALGHATSYLRDHPADWSLRLVVATIHEVLGDLTSAQSELERVVRAEPSMPLPHYRLAMLYRDGWTDQERARGHLRAYLRLAPKGPHAAEVRSALSDVADVSAGARLVLPQAAASLSGEAIQ